MRIDLSSNLREVIPAVEQLFSDQLPFACAKALTDTAKAVKDAMPARLQQDLDRPTAFTTQGFYLTAARKDKLEATVGVKDRQAEYLGYQIEGGTRAPKRKALRLPARIQVDVSGNLPKGIIQQLIARAQAGKRATKGQARKAGISAKTDIFYGEPGDGRPAGIYQRVAVGAGRTRLLPLIVFPRRSATYRSRFDFAGEAERVAEREFGPALERAWATAKATAR